jgi:hypothetical protein
MKPTLKGFVRLIELTETSLGIERTKIARTKTARALVQRRRP